MSPLLVATSFAVVAETIPDGVTAREWARVRHQLRVNNTRTIEQIADAAYVTDDVVLLILAGRGAAIEPA